MRPRIPPIQFVVLAAALLVVAAPVAARAAPVDNIQAEVQAGGFPNASASITTPPPATAADVAAFDEDGSTVPPSLTNENMLSPDPTQPLPVVTLSYQPAGGTALPGIIVAPGSTWTPTTADASGPLWEIQSMLAVKHEIENGTEIAGLALRLASEAEPYYWISVPPDARRTPQPTVMPALLIEQYVRAGLPAWAANASVSAIDWTGSERRLVITLTMPATAFQANDVENLVAPVMTDQQYLNANGAGIGSIVVEIADPVSNLPLFTFAGDAGWGRTFAWSNPLVEAWTGDVSNGWAAP